jgi:hypothetical protein
MLAQVKRLVFTLVASEVRSWISHPLTVELVDRRAMVQGPYDGYKGLITVNALQRQVLKPIPMEAQSPLIIECLDVMTLIENFESGSVIEGASFIVVTKNNRTIVMLVNTNSNASNKEGARYIHFDIDRINKKLILFNWIVSWCNFFLQLCTMVNVRNTSTFTTMLKVIPHKLVPQ